MDYKDEASHTEHVRFCENLVMERRMLPGSVSLAVAILDGLASGNKWKAVEFTEDGRKRSMSLQTAMKHLLTTMPINKEHLQETAVKNYAESHPGCSYGEALIGASRENPEFFDYSRSPVYKAGHVDELREKEITSYMESHQGVSYSMAFVEVSKKFPQYYEILSELVH
jgi:hypothetical protein